MVTFWRLGSPPVPTTHIGQRAKDLEDQGWDGLVIGQDIGGTADSYVLLALAAAATTTLKLGTGVSTPIRDPMDLANTAAVLHAVSKGRTMLSLGRGDGAFARVARQPLKTAEFEQYVQRVRQYLDREDVDLGGFSSNMRDLFTTDPDLDLARPLLDVSGTGPKTIDIGAHHADSVTFAVGADPVRLDGCVKLAREARAMWNPGLSLSLGCHVPLAVVSDGVSRADARNIIRGAVIRHARFSAFEGRPLDGLQGADRALALDVTGQTRDVERSMPRPPDYSLTIPDELVDSFAIVGEPAECADRLSALIETGVDRISLITRVPNTDHDERNAARIAEHVLPRLR